MIAHIALHSTQARVYKVNYEAQCIDDDGPSGGNMTKALKEGIKRQKNVFAVFSRLKSVRILTGPCQEVDGVPCLASPILGRLSGRTNPC